MGLRTEAVILAELIKRGYTVLTPFGHNHRYDLVIECGGQFLRVQSKTGRLRNGVVRFATQSTRTNMRRVYARGYENEIDLFVVYCPDTGKVYALPAAEARVTEGRLRVAPTGNGQARGVRWAADFELADP